MMALNYNLFYFLNSFVGASQAWDFVIFFIAEYMDMIVLVAALLFFFVHKDYPEERRFISYQQMRTRIKEIILVTSSVFSAWVVVVLLKSIFAVARPYMYLDNVQLLFTYGGYDSLPSGHAAFFGALAVAVYFHHKYLSLVLALSALFISIARIMSGVHLPSEIIAGFLLGGLLSWGIYTLYAKIFRFLRS
ncbi:MAG: phosphatase PAP2 family protein [Candidatus Pacebacteria bacterium]|nr:phosphatase PAP2 family protein [Candidatus Paceibacterota bacterium]